MDAGRDAGRSRLCLSRDRSRQTSQFLLNPGLDRVGINIAGYRDHRTAHPVIMAVEISHLVRCKFGGGIGKAFGRMTIRTCAEELFGKSHHRAVARLLFARMDGGYLIAALTHNVTIAESWILQRLRQ